MVLGLKCEEAFAPCLQSTQALFVLGPAVRQGVQAVVVVRLAGRQAGKLDVAGLAGRPLILDGEQHALQRVPEPRQFQQLQGHEAPHFILPELDRGLRQALIERVNDLRFHPVSLPTSRS